MCSMSAINKASSGQRLNRSGAGANARMTIPFNAPPSPQPLLLILLGWRTRTWGKWTRSSGWCSCSTTTRRWANALKWRKGGKINQFWLLSIVGQHRSLEIRYLGIVALFLNRLIENNCLIFPNNRCIMLLSAAN
jgi:hypothetical protein